MTTMTAEPIEALDLSDLDLLDDPHSHLACSGCNPGGPGPAVAYCGKSFFAQGRFVAWEDVPNEVTCPECVQVPICSRCGE